MAGCPHADIRFCPLYVAANGPGGGCDDGELGQGGCAVDRGMEYAGAVAALRIREPAIVATCEWNETKKAMQDQRRRNMVANGIH